MIAAAIEQGDLTLGDVCGEEAGKYVHLPISDLALDSRDVRPGTAFVALAGKQTHGLAHARAALAHGAVVVLFDPQEANEDVPAPAVAISNLRARLGEFARRFYGRTATTPAVTGVTGTNGKTTVAWLLAQALTRAGRTAGYIGTLGFGVVPRLSTHRLTTPDCLTLHREIALMPVAEVALEVSSIGLVQERLAGLDVSGAVFTNLTQDHLDLHGNMAAYAQAKAQLFERPELEHGVLNYDDPYAAQMQAAAADHVRLLSVSTDPDAAADICGVVERNDLRGLQIRLSGSYGSAKLRSPLFGRFNAENILLTLGALLNLDVPLAEACDALSESAGPPGRMEVFGGGDTPCVVVDYAHTPDALARVLATLVPLTAGELWCVFGCGGDRDSEKRHVMGVAASRADHVVLTDDNPRNEDPAAIIAGIGAGLAEHPSVIVEHDRAAAIKQAVAQAGSNDIVLVAGRGHESMQQRRENSVPLDDRACVRAALEERA